jgi:hypothetical protein
MGLISLPCWEVRCQMCCRQHYCLRASAVLDTQTEAIARAKELNPSDHPDVARVRETDTGGPDKWRKA